MNVPVKRKIGDFLEISLDIAGRIIQEKNLAAQRDFLKRGGSNFFLKDRLLSFSWEEPFLFIAEGNRAISSDSLNFKERIKDSSFGFSSDSPFKGEEKQPSRASSPELNSAFWSIWRCVLTLQRYLQITLDKNQK